MQPTREQLRSLPLRAMAMEIAVKRAYAEVWREKANAAYAAILGEHPLYVRPRWWNMAKLAGNRIVEARYVYLCNMDSQEYAAYESACQAWRDSLGLALEPGHCPALCAESDARDAERRMVDAVAPFFGLTFDKLICGGMDKLEKFVDLTMRLGLSQGSA